VVFGTIGGARKGNVSLQPKDRGGLDKLTQLTTGEKVAYIELSGDAKLGKRA